MDATLIFLLHVIKISAIKMANNHSNLNPNQNTPGVKKVAAKKLKKAVLKKM